MQRFNCFNFIHKGLRAMLYDCALTLQQTSFSDPEEAAVAIQKIRDAVFLFREHGQHEDHFVMPPIKDVAAVMVTAFENEHVVDHALGSKLIQLINIFLDTTTDETRIIAGSALNKAYMDFMLFNLAHMAKEEIEINPVLWELFTDEELIAVNTRILESISDEEKALSGMWMLKGINKEEAKDWILSVKQTSPDFVFQSMIGLSDKYLPERFRKEVHQYVLSKGISTASSPLSGALAS
jgi:hypothetical protein